MLRISFFCVAFLFLFCLLLPWQGFAASSAIAVKTEDEQLLQWDLSAESVTSLNDSEIMEATGKVFLRRGDDYMKADFARYYASTKWVYLKGNVTVHLGKDDITAEEAEFDLSSRVGWLKKGRLFMAGPHAYMAGDRIDKHWGDVYSFTNAKVTTCDGDVPAWSITAREAVVEIDGYARLTGSTFQVKDTPVAATPYFIFPTKSKRQSGFLVPDLGQSSVRGVYYNQPFFWAINDSSDITFNEYVMSKRGFMHGVEYRTRPTTDTAGWVRLDWLNDTKTTTMGSPSLPYSAYNRTNKERYWLRGMYDTLLPDPNWRFKADLDFVSDQDYLNEFEKGFSGFQRSRSELFSLFHRDLREKNRERLSGALLTRDWERVSVGLAAQYTQNPALGHGNAPSSSDTTVQRLPELDAFLHKGRIFPALPLEVETGAQAAYMHRRNGSRGARYEFTPRMSLPLTSAYGSLIASAGVRHTLYNTENRETADVFAGQQLSNWGREDLGPERSSLSKGTARTVPEFDIAAATEFARVYTFDTASLPLDKSSVGKSQWAGLRHSVQPRVEFRQRPYEDQRENPYYDSSDRLGPRTELVYSITNVLTRKRESVVMRQGENGEQAPAVQTSYTDLLRLRFEQAYDYREAVRKEERETYERRPFGDVIADLTVNTTESLSVYTRNNWSPYEQKMTRHQSGVAYTVPSWGKIYAGYDYRSKLQEYTRWRNEDLRFINVGGSLDMWGPWSISAAYRHDLVNKDNSEKELRLAYTHQCFQLIGQVFADAREKDFQLMVVLTGLGD